MQTIDAELVNARLDPARLVPALHAAFRDGADVPVRHHHSVPLGGGNNATLLLMPAWNDGAPPRHIGIKTVTVHPGNPAHGLPSIQGVYLLLDGATGTPRALIDGPALTARRTAAASALAATFLARDDAAHLLVVGTGRLAPELIAAHAAVRPIRRVAVWGRDRAKAHAVASEFADAGFEAAVAGDLETAVQAADIVSCATTAAEPVFAGAWLSPGTHVDLVGGFRPDMREADDDAIRRASVFVDTREGAGREAGDIVRAIESGALAANGIAADLFDLCAGRHRGRARDDEITLFKSVGTALEDLAAAELLVEGHAP